ncbi:MAG TPA: phosphoribosyltransferase [Ramlibacter sp.]|jgi:predicted phosphoribosyltransferase|uniref:phosphoribosyltransferase n=1 Tax=Ramlibacter sp. TaxID=1917967 RepID=UPI002D5DF3A4|nr:phosphoribosyltransferase [Ramlibacter sp.]HZY18425.1 phosphoribosyltransferase [Ramlibacter sp.]
MTGPGVPYAGRQQAGRVLAAALDHLRGRDDLLVLALPRGGVPVACEVATALRAPLDVLVVRKLGLPGQPEYAMGAIASGGIRVMNRLPFPVPPEAVEAVAAQEGAELQRRERLYRGEQPPPPIAGRTVIVVDDGLATGATMEAAARALRERQPRWLCLAAPVGAPQTCRRLRAACDELVCPAQPEPFQAVGLWYERFVQCEDHEVRALLEAARTRRPAPAEG